MNYSITQQDSRKDQGDRVMPRVNLAVEILERFGYSLRHQAYREQAYYTKTIAKDTAEHGQFKFDMNCDSHGATIIGSNDCQLPLLVYLGINLNGEVLPMVKALEVKNLKCYDSRIHFLNSFLPTSREGLFSLVTGLKNKVFTKAESLAIFAEVQGYKSSLMKCLPCIPTVADSNGYSLFLCLVDTLINGNGVSHSGKKIRAIRHIRRKIQLIEKMLEILCR